MTYKQKYDDLFLLDANLPFPEAFDMLSFEVADNLFRVNNMYCKKKYGNPFSVFWGFPAGEEYDSKIREFAYLANDFINLRYAVLDADPELCEMVIRGALRLRREIQAEMKKL